MSDTDHISDDGQAEIDLVKAIIAKLPADAQRRVNMVAQILRDLLVNGYECELAFTLIMAELTADPQGGNTHAAQTQPS